MACEGCDPVNGDTACSISLPLLCVLHYKQLDRPYYFYEPNLSSYIIKDGGYYNPWSGGILVVTDSFQGVTLTSYAQGDSTCKDYYGQ
jgi:hypothetical protein